MFNYSIYIMYLPKTMAQALIYKSLIETRERSWYRPILLLPSEYNILVQITALQLEKVIPSLVKGDQTGFITNHFCFDNVRLLFNIVYSAKSVKDPVLTTSLDAERPLTMQYSIFSNIFRIIQTLYNHPTAIVRTNIHHHAFPYLEPLAIAIRSHPSISGVRAGEEDHVISLYADDIILGQC